MRDAASQLTRVSKCTAHRSDRLAASTVPKPVHDLLLHCAGESRRATSSWCVFYAVAIPPIIYKIAVAPNLPPNVRYLPVGVFENLDLETNQLAPFVMIFGVIFEKSNVLTLTALMSAANLFLTTNLSSCASPRLALQEHIQKWHPVDSQRSPKS